MCETETEEQLLAGSVTSVTTTGIDDEDELELPDEGLPTTGSVWDEAW